MSAELGADESNTSQKAVDLRAQLELQLKKKKTSSRSPFGLLKKSFGKGSKSPGYHAVGSAHADTSLVAGSEYGDVEDEFEATLSGGAKKPATSNPELGAQLQRDGYNLDDISDDDLDLNIDLYQLRSESTPTGWCSCLRAPGGPSPCAVQ